MCEVIGRVDADPDVLPRTENFGLDYIAFSAMCPKCPPDFLKLTYNCVKVCILSKMKRFIAKYQILEFLSKFGNFPAKQPIFGIFAQSRKFLT